MQKETDHSLEETIIKYLKGQEIKGEDVLQSPFMLLKEPGAPEEDVAFIMEQIMKNVLKSIRCKDKYENMTLQRNQYALFDLSHFIPDFCIDEEMMSKISFTETVLISKIDSLCKNREVEPKPVGGFCLTIETVDGYIPKDKEMTLEEKLERDVANIFKSAKERFKKMPHDQFDATESDDIVKQKLKDYEVFLKKEMQHNCKKFVVHLSCEFQVDGRNAGSTLTSWVDRNFHTLEERRYEYININEDSVDNRTLYVGLQKEKYYIHAKGPEYNEKKYYSMVKTKDLVCEGASFILMRYLALIKHTGVFELSTMYINGGMCRNIYDCIGSTKGVINNKEVEICKIYRYIIEECGIEHHCVTVLTVNGFIISQEWEGCNYILNRNPLLHLGDSSVKYERTILHKTWTDDLELLSKYLDYKTVAEMEMQKYLFGHPEIKELFSDYVNNILMMKPRNILPFTMDYFQSLCPMNLPRQTYFHESDDDDYIY